MIFIICFIQKGLIVFFLFYSFRRFLFIAYSSFFALTGFVSGWFLCLLFRIIFSSLWSFSLFSPHLLFHHKKKIKLFSPSLPPPPALFHYIFLSCLYVTCSVLCVSNNGHKSKYSHCTRWVYSCLFILIIFVQNNLNIFIYYYLFLCSR